ncbi:putative Recombinational DNA repair ATPase (RecF pathway) [uncultured Desulfobacterium sp.]|uniref:Putative Recombinational DNA repair ATPase (RecF pathway) n=1 Tax=uncultured Desulfobacterium sp. TaxID=201089 RepID=A0A445MZI4_9BACT|nr:putative Recombinational DNA repair ATPase (RecF pathway) [uncultured Desulfobacterium sp.]
MNDERLEILQHKIAEPAAGYKSVRISRIRISNYRFFREEIALDFNGANLLVYGENGSGKSTIYRALEYLAGKRFEGIAAEKNIFSDAAEPLIEFGFTNGKELIIHSDMTEMPEGFDFIKGLSVFAPMLDYKKLLKVHYATTLVAGRINVYDMLRELFKDYEAEDGIVLSGIKDPSRYFESLERIVNSVLLDETNRILAMFDADISLQKFTFKTEFTPDNRLEPVINIEIDYREQAVDNYHTFLNEARLSALAVSLYFASTKTLLGSLRSESVKILVLDDLLIGLDMGNRFKLLDILKTEFSEFQIFFFTYDKELFEIYKNKMPWEKYELYMDDTADIPAAIVKRGSSETERAKEFYAAKEYDCCALVLRKGFEKLLKSYLSPREQLDRNCNELNLADLVGRAKKKCTGEAKKIMEKLDSDRRHILNPLSHNDNRNIYAQELKSAMDDLEKLKDMLR